MRSQAGAWGTSQTQGKRQVVMRWVMLPQNPGTRGEVEHCLRLEQQGRRFSACEVPVLRTYRLDGSSIPGPDGPGYSSPGLRP